MSDAFDAAVRDAGLLTEEKARAWEAVADVMTVQMLGSPSSDIGRADHHAVIEHWEKSTRAKAYADQPQADTAWLDDVGPRQASLLWRPGSLRRGAAIAHVDIVRLLEFNYPQRSASCRSFGK